MQVNLLRIEIVKQSIGVQHKKFMNQYSINISRLTSVMQNGFRTLFGTRYELLALICSTP